MLTSLNLSNNIYLIGPYLDGHYLIAGGTSVHLNVRSNKVCSINVRPS